MSEPMQALVGGVFLGFSLGIAVVHLCLVMPLLRQVNVWQNHYFEARHRAQKRALADEAAAPGGGA